jgi:hypothetical protein
MAKIIGPLCSISAAGSLGDTITFQSVHGRPVARRHASPTNTPTPSQAARRASYAAGVTAWHALTAEEVSAWRLAGSLKALTGFNAFISDWLLTPPPATSAIWDDGASIWDGGSTLWDT